ncbi:hypothetical protein FS749_003263 [Ceratobasidium sp. UAMH 11750]|nr:hypothetical protein FS749_003263 [Ceratobasidium sp. UAMH 11750]
MSHHRETRVKPEYLYGDRLTPDREDRARRFVFDTRVPGEQNHNWDVEGRRKFRLAAHNPTILRDYSFAKHQARADLALPKPGEPAWRKGPEVCLRGDQPTVLVGRDMSVGLVYIPGFVDGTSLTNFTHATETHMKRELRPTARQAQPQPSATGTRKSARQSARQCQQPPNKSTPKPVPQRHQGDVLRKDLGFCGDRHFGVWHARGQQHFASFEPTRDTTRNGTNITWTSRMQFLDSCHPVDRRVESFMELARPDLLAALQRTRKSLMEHPGVLPFNCVWHTSFPGRAVIVNRQTGEHLDQNGVRRGWDVIVAAGDFEGGEFYLGDVKVRCPFQPGDLVAFDGTALRHRIEPFSGRLRLSHVYYVHQSLLTECDIAANFSDVYLSDLVDRIAPYTRPPPIQGPPLPPSFNKGKGRRLHTVDRPRDEDGKRKRRRTS